MPPRPRGRPRKKNPNDSRIHAAVEAMSPYGFPLDLVQVTVGELLNVYGGNEGWVFIEDDSYSLLLETLLEKTNGPQQEDDSSQREVGDADDRDASAAGPSLPSSSNSGTSDPVLLTNLALDSASQPNEAPNTAAPLIPTCSNLGALDAMLQSNLDLVSASQPNETPNTARESNGRCNLPPAANSGGAETLGNGLAQSSPVMIQSTPPDSLPPRRRRPYHGWVSNDEVVDLVQLAPAPLPERIARLLKKLDE